MRIGQFFSLRQGRVGQYLSSRVLIVRTPFQPLSQAQETCYFGFDKLSQAQKFAQYLANAGYVFQLRKSQMVSEFPYEIKLPRHVDLAKSLAYWDRQDHRQFAQASQNQRNVTRAAIAA